MERHITIGLLGIIFTIGGLASTPTPAEIRTNQTRAAAAKEPARTDLKVQVAAALVRQARESDDPRFCAQADLIVTPILQKDPADLEALKVRVQILYCQKSYVKSLELAKKLNKQTPDDVMVYGYVADADMALGDYKDAETEAQWMLDLRPGNIPGMERGAELRELFGDPEGAIDFYNQCFRRLGANDADERAWILTRVGGIQLARGEFAGAERAAQEAMKAVPESPLALVLWARAKFAQKEYTAAAELYKKRLATSSNPKLLFELGLSLENAGKKEEASAQFNEFLKGEPSPAVFGHELVRYHQEVTKNLDSALQIAHSAAQERQDSVTLADLAWSLYLKGEYKEAREQMKKALAVGMRDGQMLYRAAVISMKLGEKAEAVKYAKLSLKANPESDEAMQVPALLGSVEVKTSEMK